MNLPTLIAIQVRLNQNVNEKAGALRQLFGRKPGSASVRLRLERSKDFSIMLDVAAKVRPDKEFRAEVERICGPEALEILAQ